MAIYIGVDVGGTKIAAAALDLATEKLSAETIIATPRNGHEAVLEAIAELVRRICAEIDLSLEDLEGVGVGLPATIDYELEQTLLLPNIPGDWWNLPVAEKLRAKLGCPVTLINDARAFTLAEARLGAGRDIPTVVCVTLGTGIGGGIAINGRLHLGLMGSAGEVGHHTINFNGLPDGSGAPGGFEGYASGPAMTAQGIKAVIQGQNTQLTALIEGDIKRMSPQIIAQAAQNGDSIAEEILTRAGFYIGVGIANLLTILAPQRVIIGGGLAELGEPLLQPMRETVWRYCRTIPPEKIDLQLAALGNQAGVIGAALWAAQS